MVTSDNSDNGLKFFKSMVLGDMLDKVIELSIASSLDPADKDKIAVSGEAFYDAIKEADCDAYFLEQRRSLSNGVSEGKLAGILYFRLTRHRIIHLSPDICEKKEYAHFQEKRIIKIVMALLNIEIDHIWINKRIGTQRDRGLRKNFQNIYEELLYITARRHYNQESLALFFDTLVYLSHALDEIVPQKKH